MKIKKLLVLMLTITCAFSLTVNAANSKTSSDDAIEEPAEEAVTEASEIDLSNLSFDDLVALKDRINLAIWESEEWEEVTVPQGEWIVGEDIPAGHWTIKSADVDLSDPFMYACDFYWGPTDENGRIKPYERNGGGHATIYNPAHRYYTDGSITELNVELKEGIVVKIDTSRAPATFTPYSGKPDLQFRRNND